MKSLLQDTVTYQCEARCAHTFEECQAVIIQDSVFIRVSRLPKRSGKELDGGKIVTNQISKQTNKKIAIPA